MRCLRGGERILYLLKNGIIFSFISENLVTLKVNQEYLDFLICPQLK
jgi:hypothetical protein